MLNSLNILMFEVKPILVFYCLLGGQWEQYDVIVRYLLVGLDRMFGPLIMDDRVWVDYNTTW